MNICLRSLQVTVTVTLIPVFQLNPSVVQCCGGSSAAISKCSLLWRLFLSSQCLFFNCAPFGTECWSAEVSSVYRCVYITVWERIRTSLFDIVPSRYWKSSWTVKLLCCYKLADSVFVNWTTYFVWPILWKWEATFRYNCPRLRS